MRGVLLAQFGRLSVASVYFPKGSGKDRDNSRVPYKMDFYRAVFERIQLQRKVGPVFVVGDYNTAHHTIDIARPKSNLKASGFLPEERDELTRWEDAGWVDTFRHRHPEEPGSLHWVAQFGGARKDNVGWRIDYVFASKQPIIGSKCFHLAKGYGFRSLSGGRRLVVKPTTAAPRYTRTTTRSRVMAQPFPQHPNLTGGFAPIQMECDIRDVVVVGEVPSDLNGSFYRNGPNPQFAPRGFYHWFAGDGMVHAFHIENGRVSYRNRWVQTKQWLLERDAGRALFSVFNPMEQDPSVAGLETDGVANTNIIWHGGKLLALERVMHLSSWILFHWNPVALTTTPASYKTDDGASEKIDQETGEMLFFGYNADGGISASNDIQRGGS